MPNFTMQWKSGPKTKINKRMVEVLRSILKDSDNQLQIALFSIFISLYNARQKMSEANVFQSAINEIDGHLRTLDRLIKVMRVEHVKKELRNIRTSLDQLPIGFSFRSNMKIMTKFQEAEAKIDQLLKKS